MNERKKWGGNGRGETNSVTYSLYICAIYTILFNLNSVKYLQR